MNMYLLESSKHTIYSSKHCQKIMSLLKGNKPYDIYFVWRSCEKI